MPEQRKVEAVVGKPATTSEIETVPEETRAQKKARLAQVLDRGVTNDRLAVPNLPKHLHGEWIARDPSEIARMQGLGFWIDNEFAPLRSFNSDGTKTSQVADVVFMVCPKEDYDIIEEIRNEKFKEVHGDGKQRVRRNQKGDHPSLNNPEKDFDITGMTTIDESKETSIGGTELAAAVKQTVSEAVTQQPPK